MTVVSMVLNKRPIRRDVPDRMHLADFVRDEGRQTGTHLGCEHGVCGACTVLVDGLPVRSCITFAVACQDRNVTTIEGYDDDPVMALLRAAFSRHHALQCGFCTPGMLATARDIVLRFPDAGEKQIRVELSGNLCRCTGYLGIVDAIMDVLQKCRGHALPEITRLRTVQTLPVIEDSSHTQRNDSFKFFKAIDTGTVPAGIPDKNEPSKESAGSTKSGTSIRGSFRVPYPANQVWKFMADLPAVAGCLPGAELTEHEGDRVKGRVAIKFGPMAASFNGGARLDKNDAEMSAVLRGAGQDSISKSRANGDVAYKMVDLDGQSTKVEVDLLYSLQGPLAQFSRSGLVKDFVGRLIQEFGKNVTLRMDPNRADDNPPPIAKLNAFSLGMSVLWSRVRRLFKREDPPNES